MGNVKERLIAVVKFITEQREEKEAEEIKYMEIYRDEEEKIEGEK